MHIPAHTEVGPFLVGRVLRDEALQPGLGWHDHSILRVGYMWVWSGAWGAQQAAAASLLEFADDDLAPIHIAMQQWKQLGQDCGMRQRLENKY